MPPTTKTLSPAELAKLEAAFATDPASQAYKPLAEAYLAMGRYMEAMVVCKKGVKAHPTLADPRVLLARVYADQGKDKKALEELQGALQVVPSDKVALRLTAQLQWKAGERESAKATIAKAFEADGADAETLAAMKEMGVEPPKPAAPPPPPPPVMQQAPVAAQVPMTPANGVSSPNIVVEANVTQPNPMPVEAQPRPAQQQQRRTAPSTGRTTGSRPAATRRPSFEPEESISEVSEVSELSVPPRRKKKESSHGLAKALFFMLIFAVPVGAGAYYGVGQYIAKRNREVNRLITTAQDLLKTDTFHAYKEACKLAEQALDLDPNSALAHRILSFAYTVRWGEHEHDDTIKSRAEEHLREGKESRDQKNLSYQFAAESLLAYYSGKGSEGLRQLEDRVKAAEAENRKSALLYVTLGLLQMNQGDLERARESLEKAQAASPDDPRVYISLGNLQRRRGNDGSALGHFNSALRYTKNAHPEALLGTALLILDQPEPAKGYITAAKYIKSLMEMEPPPSPRQLAQAHMVKALLVSRASRDIPLYTDEKFKKELEDGTGVSPDQAKANKEIAAQEREGTDKDKTNPDLFIIRAKRLFWEAAAMGPDAEASATAKYDEAAGEVKKAIEANATVANYHVELAKIFLKKKGGEAQAEDALKKALTLVPNSPKLLSMLGQAQYRLKKVDDARATLEKATEDQKTKNGEARYLLARIYRDDKKDLKRAAELFDRAAADYYSDPSMAAIAYDDLGYTYEQAGTKDKARIAYEKALNADKELAVAYCHYARFLAKDNQPADKDKIKAVAGEYLKLDPRGEQSAECNGDMKRLANPG
jgi:tetratricopeptide (TPR) repeat protein